MSLLVKLFAISVFLFTLPCLSNSITMPTKSHIEHGGRGRVVDGNVKWEPLVIIRFYDSSGKVISSNSEVIKYNPSLFQYQKMYEYYNHPKPFDKFSKENMDFIGFRGRVVDGVFRGDNAHAINRYLNDIGIVVNNNKPIDLSSLPLSSPKQPLDSIPAPLDWEAVQASLSIISGVGIKVCEQESMLSMCELKWAGITPDTLQLHATIDGNKPLLIGDIHLRDFQSKYINQN